MQLDIKALAVFLENSYYLKKCLLDVIVTVHILSCRLCGDKPNPDENPASNIQRKTFKNMKVK